MAHWYLSPYVGDGTEGNRFRPAVADGDWASIDLSPPGRAKGLAVVRTSQPVPTRLGAVDLGDGLDVVLPRLVWRRLGNRLGISFAGSDRRLRAVLTELMVLHGRVDGSRWRPLQANRRGMMELWCGELVFAAPVVVGASYSESFNQADSTTLGPDLTWTELSGNWETVSNRARSGTNNSAAQARAEHDLASADHLVKAPVNFAVVNGVGGVGARWSASAVTLYRAALDSAGRLDITRIESGSGTDIASQSRTISAGVDYIVRIECNGSSIRARVDSDTWLSVTDTVITGNTRFGLAGYRTNRDIWHDWVEAIDLADLPQNLTVSVAATVTATDTLTSSGTNYDETGRVVTASATVTAIDAVAGAESALVSVGGTVGVADSGGFVDTPQVAGSATVTAQDAAAMTSASLVSVGATVTASESWSGAEALSVAISAQVGSTDVASFADVVLVTIGSTVGLVEALTLTEGATVSVVASIAATDASSFVQSLSVSVAAFVGATDVQASGEAASVNVAAFIGVGDTAGFFEAAVILTSSTITATDTLNAGGTAYDETGRTVSVVGSVTSSDLMSGAEAATVTAAVSLVVGVVWAGVESVTVAGAVVVGSSDVLTAVDATTTTAAASAIVIDALSGVEQALVFVGATVLATDTKAMAEETALTISSVVGSQHSWAGAESLALTGLATVSSSDTGALNESSSVNIAATVTSVDVFRPLNIEVALAFYGTYQFSLEGKGLPEFEGSAPPRAAGKKGAYKGSSTTSYKGR